MVSDVEQRFEESQELVRLLLSYYSVVMMLECDAAIVG